MVPDSLVPDCTAQLRRPATVSTSAPREKEESAAKTRILEARKHDSGRSALLVSALCIIMIIDSWLFSTCRLAGTYQLHSDSFINAECD